MLNALWRPVAGARKRQGGWRQRAEADDEEPDHKMSRLAAGHLKEWCDGVSSAALVKRHLANATADGLVHPMVQRLCQGAMVNEQHAHTTLMKEVDKTRIPSLITTLAGDVTHVVLPSSLTNAMFTFYPWEFKVRFGAEVPLVRKFWRSFLLRPQCQAWARHHPFLSGKSVGDLKHTIPLAVHEDAGPCSKTLSANCVS